MRAIFRRLLTQARRRVPALAVTLHTGGAREFPAARDFAYCKLDGKQITVVVAPRMARQARSRIEGVLRHELAHAVFFALGEPRHSEREADQLAAALFGGLIRYDRDDVQTTGVGRHPRPAHLRP